MAAGSQCNTGRVLANSPALNLRAQLHFTFLSKIQFPRANSDAARFVT